jgi:hypothetical protein
VSPVADLTTVEELRAAAAKLREVAGKATDGPWHPDADELGRGWDLRSATDGHMAFGLTKADAAWIALVHPGLAEPLAEWLEKTATEYGEDTYMDAPEHGDYCGPGYSTCDGHADILFCDRCGRPLEPEAAYEDQCGCWDAAIRTARVIIGTDT